MEAISYGYDSRSDTKTKNTKEGRSIQRRIQIIELLMEQGRDKSKDQRNTALTHDEGTHTKDTERHSNRAHSKVAVSLVIC